MFVGFRSSFSPLFLSSYRFCSRFKVYTKTGDKGESSLFNGERRKKTDIIFDALGSTDETNSYIGYARELLPKECISKDIPIDSWLHSIQSRLLDIGSSIATPNNEFSNKARINRVNFNEKHVNQLEEWIDLMDLQLPPLKNFILPGGGQCASILHIARSVCRRAERNTCGIDENISEASKKYLNRLSDFLFVSARYIAMKEGHSDIIYKKEKE